MVCNGIYITRSDQSATRMALRKGNHESASAKRVEGARCASTRAITDTPHVLLKGSWSGCMMGAEVLTWDEVECRHSSLFLLRSK
jgi:hypothetical protein